MTGPIGCTGVAGRAYADDPAVDAAVRLTASSWGPPMGTPLPDRPTPMWWVEAYGCACGAVEAQVIDALRGGDR